MVDTVEILEKLDQMVVFIFLMKFTILPSGDYVIQMRTFSQQIHPVVHAITSPVKIQMHTVRMHLHLLQIPRLDGLVRAIKVMLGLRMDPTVKTLMLVVSLLAVWVTSVLIYHLLHLLLLLDENVKLIHVLLRLVSHRTRSVLILV